MSRNGKWVIGTKEHLDIGRSHQGFADSDAKDLNLANVSFSVFGPTGIHKDGDWHKCDGMKAYYDDDVQLLERLCSLVEYGSSKVIRETLHDYFFMVHQKAGSYTTADLIKVADNALKANEALSKDGALTDIISDLDAEYDQKIPYPSLDIRGDRLDEVVHKFKPSEERTFWEAAKDLEYEISSHPSYSSADKAGQLEDLRDKCECAGNPPRRYKKFVAELSTKIFACKVAVITDPLQKLLALSSSTDAIPMMEAQFEELAVLMKGLTKGVDDDDVAKATAILIQSLSVQLQIRKRLNDLDARDTFTIEDKVAGVLALETEFESHLMRHDACRDMFQDARSKLEIKTLEAFAVEVQTFPVFIETLDVHTYSSTSPIVAMVTRMKAIKLDLENAAQNFGEHTEMALKLKTKLYMILASCIESCETLMLKYKENEKTYMAIETAEGNVTAKATVAAKKETEEATNADVATRVYVRGRRRLHRKEEAGKAIAAAAVGEKEKEIADAAGTDGTAQMKAKSATSIPAGFTISSKKRGNAANITWSGVVGMYARLPERVNGKHVYARVSDNGSIVCWCGPSGLWQFSTKQAKDSNDDEAFVESVEHSDGSDSPLNHKEWNAKIGGAWKLQHPVLEPCTSEQVAEQTGTPPALIAGEVEDEEEEEQEQEEDEDPASHRQLAAEKITQLRTIENRARSGQSLSLDVLASHLKLWIELRYRDAGDNVIAGCTATTKEIKAYYEAYPTVAKRIRKKGLETFVGLHADTLYWTPAKGGACASVSIVSQTAAGTLHGSKCDAGGSDDDKLDAGVMCIICTEQIVVSARGKCNHVTCHTCALRVRTFQKEWTCLHPGCTSLVPALSLSIDLDEKFRSKGTPVTTTARTAKRFGVTGTSMKAVTAAQDLLKYECRICKEDQHTAKDLAVHVAKHGVRYCKLCLDNVHHFMGTEQVLYSMVTDEYQNHLDNEHMLCGFCNCNFFNDDMLLYHMKDAHEECQICLQAGRPFQYFEDYASLEQHYVNDHGYSGDDSTARKPDLDISKATVFDQEEMLLAQSDAESSEFRMDSTDGKAYTLESFMDVYGGSRQNPPQQWVESKETGVGWSCPQCTYINSPTSAACVACGRQNNSGTPAVMNPRSVGGEGRLQFTVVASKSSSSRGGGGGGGSAAAAASPIAKRRGKVTEVIMLPTSINVAGAIIGPGGNDIHDIRETSGCKIVTVGRDLVELDDGSCFRELTLVGSSKQVSKAKALIDDTLDSKGFPSLSACVATGTPQIASLPSMLPMSGYCFVCSNDTFKECIAEDLFGSSYNNLDEMIDNIIVGETKLYLLNYDSMKLFGSFVATSTPGLNIKPNAWGHRFPAQVRIKRLQRVRTTVRRGLFQQGWMDPSLVAKADQALGLVPELVPAARTPTRGSGGGGSSNGGGSRLSSTTPVRTKPPSSSPPSSFPPSASPPSASLPSLSPPSSSSLSNSISVSLPPLPPVSENVSSTLQAYKTWIENMESILVPDAGAALPTRLYQDAEKLADSAQSFLTKVRVVVDKKLDSLVDVTRSDTVEFLDSSRAEHEQQLEHELLRHKKKLKQIAEEREAKLAEAKKKHVNALRAAKGSHLKAMRKIPSLRIVRQHVDSSLYNVEKLRAEQERLRVEEVAALKLKLARTKKERDVATASAEKEKAAVEKAAAKKAKQHAAAVAKKEAAIKDAEEEYARLLAAKKAEIEKMFEQATEATEKLYSAAETQFQDVFAAATSQKEMHDREAAEIARQLSRLTAGADLDSYATNVPRGTHDADYVGIARSNIGDGGGSAGGSASGGSAGDDAAAADGRDDVGDDASLAATATATATAATAAAAIGMRRKARGEFGVCSIGDYIVGMDGGVWGTIVEDGGEVWRLDNNRIARKKNEGLKWTWEPELVRQPVADRDEDEWETVEGKQRYVGVEGELDNYGNDDDEYDDDHDLLPQWNGHRPSQNTLSGGRSFTSFSMKGPRTEKSKKLASRHGPSHQPAVASKKMVQKFMADNEWKYVRTGKHEVWKRKTWRGMVLLSTQTMCVPCTPSDVKSWKIIMMQLRKYNAEAAAVD